MRAHLTASVRWVAVAALLGGTGACGSDEQPGPPARTLLEYHLLGDMPLDNRVLDPRFDRRDLGWYVESGVDPSLPAGEGTRHRMLSPVRAPSLHVPWIRCTVGGLFMGTLGPLEVSLWVGRPLDVPSPQSSLGEVQVSAVGFDPVAAAERSFALTAAPPSADLVLDGIRWRHFSTTLDQGVLGWGQLVVLDPLPHDLELTGPVVVPASTGSEQYGAYQQALRRPASGRPLEVHEVRTARAFRRALRDRFHTADGAANPLGHRVPIAGGGRHVE